MIIKKVGVVGCGFMGSGIAQICAQSGYEVLVMEKTNDLLKKGMDSIDRFLTKSLAERKITGEYKKTTMDRIKGTTSLSDFVDRDLIIEAVPERIEIKEEVFRELDQICPEQTILTSNTSTISITEIGEITSRPEKVIGTHFLSPVPPSRLLEIIFSPATSLETLTIVKGFGKTLGKEMIVTKDTPGFVFNYMLIALTQAAMELLENGIATKEDIDKAMVLGLGHPIGPIALMDFNGLDTVYLVFKSIYERTGDVHHRPPPILKNLVDSGYIGRKSGKGFYDYQP